ncbi:protein AE7-like 1 [Selaginella moellendorffii]|uniref:protein AE7-like 1 n=1 Tax=Selaginella moellendorffii TaxID=88036 RepID=UPI000D1CAADF|nr:protein AE7-like 1 [Selaginella moellendorffii]|eukprot:XP_024545231.1 protein AE7-like 1 [Selaginella moellendorffii]
MALQNANPVIHERKATRRQRPSIGDESAVEEIDALEHLRDIRDPEHPYSLEQLNVLAEEGIEVDDKQSSVLTLPRLRVRKIPGKLFVCGSWIILAVNKQLNDKERVVAAMENPYLAQTVRDCLAPLEEYE